MKKVKDHSKEPAKEIEWRKEYCYSNDGFMVVPFCPSCGEPAYEQDKCVFCGQKLVWIDKPKQYEDLCVSIGDWVAIQVYGSWGVYICYKGTIKVHASFTKPLSKEELTHFLKTFVDKK